MNPVEEEQARERFLRKFAMKMPAADQPPVEEEHITVAPAVAVAADVVEEEAPVSRKFMHQLDTLSATADHLTSLLSPGDPSGFLPGPPPPSPEVPSRSINTLPSGTTRSFDAVGEVSI